jgi:hypothetical protein
VKIMEEENHENEKYQEDYHQIKTLPSSISSH